MYCSRGMTITFHSQISGEHTGGKERVPSPPSPWIVKVIKMARVNIIYRNTDMQIKDLFFQVKKGNKPSRRGFEKNLEGGGKIAEILGGNFFSAWGGANSNTFFNAGGWQLARRSNMTGINPVTACTYMSSSKVHLYHTRPNFSFYISHFLPYLYSRKS